MSKKHDEVIQGHEYDGIEELNNPLPKWWLATFYGTIIFAVLYWGYYEIGPGPSHDETLARKMKAIETRYAQADAAAQADAENIDVAALTSDPAVIESGKAKFIETCAVCHGQNGEGIIGPNLTDKYWIHSKGELLSIVEAIREGFPEKGMPPWGALIEPELQRNIAAYVTTLQGTNPPNAKEPQGDLVE